jgi:ribonuclease-3
MRISKLLPVEIPIGIWENRFKLEVLPEQNSTQAEAWRELWQEFTSEYCRLERLESSLGYTFGQRSLLYEAITHRSAVFSPRLSQGRHSGSKRKFVSSKGQLPWNERIEFLGDAVLSVIISTLLWERPEKFSEGDLSRLRSNLVNEVRLAEIARNLTLQEVLVVGKSVKKNAPTLHDAMLADAVEALIGAVYRDGGFAAARGVVERLFAPYLQQSLGQLDRDYKTSLQEWAQQKIGEKPQYRLEGEGGPDHAKEFCVAVILQKKVLAHGRGVSKKQASQEAAFHALQHIARGAVKKKKRTQS